MRGEEGVSMKELVRILGFSLRWVRDVKVERLGSDEGVGPPPTMPWIIFSKWSRR